MPKLIYTALSKHSFFAKDIICAHVFMNGGVPLNPFSMFGYFLSDMVDRDLVRNANNRVISAVDEVWSYGPVADGCLKEIKLAISQQKPVRYFSVGNSVEKILEIEASQLIFENENIRVEFDKL